MISRFVGPLLWYRTTHRQMDLHQLWVDQNRPSPEKFRLILQRKGIAAPSVKFIREQFYKYQSSKQIFAPAPKYKGKIFSPGLDRRWAADVMVMRPGEAGHSFALVVQDIFSRYAWAVLISSPMASNEGMEAILHKAGKTPDEITTDADPGFQTKAFNELLSARGIHHTFREGRNDLATVDRLISTLKSALATHAADEGGDWSERLKGAVDGYNDNPHPRLMQGAPDDLRGPGGAIGNKIMYFHRELEEAKNIEQNTKEIQGRADKLEGEGFRVYKHKESLGRRVGDPRWGREIHTGAVDGAYVKDESGEYHPTKEVLPVPTDSTMLAEPASRLNPKVRGLLDRYKERGVAYLTGKEDKRDYASKFYNALTQVGNVKEAMKLANLGTKYPVATFVQAFPDVFKLVSPKTGGSAFVELK